MVGHVFEYNPAIRVVDDLIKAGELGEIYYMNFEADQSRPRSDGCECVVGPGDPRRRDHVRFHVGCAGLGDR